MANTVVQVQDVYNYLGIDYADQMVEANVNPHSRFKKGLKSNERITNCATLKRSDTK